MGPGPVGRKGREDRRTRDTVAMVWPQFREASGRECFLFAVHGGNIRKWASGTAASRSSHLSFPCSPPSQQGLSPCDLSLQLHCSPNFPSLPRKPCSNSPGGWLAHAAVWVLGGGSVSFNRPVDRGEAARQVEPQFSQQLPWRSCEGPLSALPPTVSLLAVLRGWALGLGPESSRGDPQGRPKLPALSLGWVVAKPFFCLDSWPAPGPLLAAIGLPLGLLPPPECVPALSPLPTVHHHSPP